MKRLALVLLSLSAGGAAAPEVLNVRHAQIPVNMCKIDGQDVSCAYLLALYNRMKAERYQREGI
jgi:hypothetical protein